MTDQPKAAPDALAGFRTLLDQARDIVLVLRPDGRIVDANLAAIAAYGYDRAALLARRIHDLRDPATIPVVPDQLARAVREGIDFETRHRRRDGATFPVEVSCRGADLGGERLLLSVIRDLTERRRAETERERSLAERQALLDSAAEGIFGMDAAGDCTFINAAAVALLGFQPAAVLGGDMHALIHHSRPDGSPYPKADCPINSAFEAGRDLHGVEEVLWRQDGSRFPALYSVSTIVEDGVVTGGVVTIVDITERKRREERVARLQVLTAALSRALDRDQVAEVIVAQAGATLGANAAVVAALSDDGRFFETLRLLGYPPADAARMQRVPVDAPLMFAEAVRRGEPVFVPTWAERVERYGHVAHIAVPGGNGGGMALPLLIEGRPIGAVGFGFPTDRTLDAEERDFARAIADLCAQALERARLHEAEGRARAVAESARRRAVAAQRQLEAVLEPLPALVAYVDAQRRYRFVNRTYEEWFAVEREDVVGRHVRDVLGAELYATITPLIERALSGERVDFEGGLTYGDGATRYVQAIYVPDVGETGEVRGYVSLVSDLTARKAAEEERDALLARERRWAAQLRGLAAASLAINAARSVDDALRVVADLARSLIGAHQAAASTMTDQSWAHATTAVSLSDTYAAYRDYAIPPDGSGIYRLVCETNHPLRLTQAELEAHPRWRGFGAEADRHPPLRGWLAAPFVGRDGGNRGLLQLSDKVDGGEFTAEDEAVVVQLAQLASVAVENAGLNEAERTARAAAEAAVRARDLFLSSTSHDLRTPLATIKGQAQLLRLRVNRDLPIDPARLADGLAAIETSAARMATLIDELMDVGRLQIGPELDLRRVPVDLVALAASCAAEIRSRGTRHDIVFAADVPSLLLDLDAGRIERVLANLLANAVKYSPDGGEIAVTVGTEGRRGGGAVGRRDGETGRGGGRW